MRALGEYVIVEWNNDNQPSIVGASEVHGSGRRTMIGTVISVGDEVDDNIAREGMVVVLKRDESFKVPNTENQSVVHYKDIMVGVESPV